jgi:alpha-tubulin suppressor-like RCC1 family protein
MPAEPISIVMGQDHFVRVVDLTLGNEHFNVREITSTNSNIRFASFGERLTIAGPKKVAANLEVHSAVCLEPGETTQHFELVDKNNNELASGSIQLRCLPDIFVNVEPNKNDTTKLIYRNSSSEDYFVRFTGNAGVTVNGESSTENVLCGACELEVNTDFSCPKYGVAAIGTLEILDSQSQQIDTRSIRCPRADHYSFAVGRNHSIARDAQARLWSWGYNGNGELGNGTFDSHYSPMLLDIKLPASTQAISIASGYEHNLLLDSNGNVWVWGSNSYGQLGSTDYYRRETQLLLDRSLFNDVRIVSITSGGYHSIALDETHGLWAWGRNYEGQLGNSTTTGVNVPYQLPSALFDGAKPIAVASGQYHNLMLDDLGRLWAWGYNNNGQLGDDSRTSRSAPMLIDSTSLGVDHWVTMAVGSSHNLALDDYGRLWSWGSNNYGELGDGTTTQKLLPTLLDTGFLNGAEIVAITAGDGFSLILDDMARMWGWGRNGDGQLGDGGYISRSTPAEVNLTELGDIKPSRIQARYNHVLMQDEQENIWAWGSNYNGQLGDGTRYSNRSLPAPVPFPIPQETMYPDIIAIRELMAPDAAIVPLEISTDDNYVIRVSSQDFDAKVLIRTAEGAIVTFSPETCARDLGFISFLPKGVYYLMVQSTDSQGGEFVLEAYVPEMSDYIDFECSGNDYGSGYGSGGGDWWGSEPDNGYGYGYGW